MKIKKTVLTEWKAYTYDVWGNARDGYDVNFDTLAQVDAYCDDVEQVRRWQS